MGSLLGDICPMNALSWTASCRDNFCGGWIRWKNEFQGASGMLSALVLRVNLEARLATKVHVRKWRNMPTITIQDRREFERYHIDQNAQVRLSFPPRRSSEQLTSLGMGGLGFYSKTLRPELLKSRTIPCRLHWKDHAPPVIVRGEVVYCVIKEIKGSRSFYYGIRFRESDRELVRPYVEILEDLASNGKIAVFLR